MPSLRSISKWLWRLRLGKGLSHGPNVPLPEASLASCDRRLMGQAEMIGMTWTSPSALRIVFVEIGVSHPKHDWSRDRDKNCEFDVLCFSAAFNIKERHLGALFFLRVFLRLRFVALQPADQMILMDRSLTTHPLSQPVTM